MKKGYLIENYSITDKQNYIPPVKTVNKIQKYSRIVLTFLSQYAYLGEPQKQ